ncbi:MAG: Protein-tyrosine sulfotransferase 1 [Anaerolineae bacterium]|jgi:hypothetical protein|nr:MAG: Protein-tyrosine sulfotransferase 1 [Anaerolineae bacterium]
MSEYERLRDSAVFICGHPKSGTTLLLSLLDSHPQLLVYPVESVFFRGVWPRLWNLDHQERLSLAKRFLLHYFESQSADHKSMLEKYLSSVQQMDQLLPSDKVRHEGDYLSAAIFAFAQAHDLVLTSLRYWVEKTPFNELYADQIFRWWPDARCIHVVRDPRDNYATYRRKHPNLSPERFSRAWNSSLEMGLRNQRRYGKSHYLLLRYEDLLLDPEKTISDIALFLDIEKDESLYQPTKLGAAWQGNSMFNDRFAGISKRPLGRWKTELDQPDAAFIEVACRRGMNILNYERESALSFQSYWRMLRFYLVLTWRLPYSLKQAVRRHYGALPQ